MAALTTLRPVDRLPQLSTQTDRHLDRLFSHFARWLSRVSGGHFLIVAAFILKGVCLNACV